MIWLIIHNWLLLLLAFLLGLLIGWWIWHRRSIEDTREAYVKNETFSTPPAPVVTPPTQMKPIGRAEPAEKVAPLATSSEPSSAPKLYTSASDGPADDLKMIKGIGPNYEKLLNEIGIYYYRQISNWTPAEIGWLDNKLEFPGRIVRDKWQEQAVTLSSGGSTEFASRYAKGETPSSYKDQGTDQS